MNILIRLRKWTVIGGLSGLDQITYSSANFIVTILLARWLDTAEFGKFAIGLAVVTFLMQIYTSFVLEPIGVLSTSNYENNKIPYLITQVKLLFALSIPFGLVLAILVWGAGVLFKFSFASSALEISLLGLPFILFPLLMRRIYYILRNPSKALIGSIIYLGIIVISILILKKANVLSSFSGTLVILFAGLFSGSLMLFFLIKSKNDLILLNLGNIFWETWSFGKWLILSGFLIGIATQSQVYMTGLLFGAEEAGIVRILQTLIQPIMLLSTALSALVIPSIAGDFSSGNFLSMQKKSIVFTIVLGSISIFYLFLLFFYGNFMKDIIFGEKYVVSTWLISAWGLVPVLLSLFWGGIMIFQSTKNLKSVLIISGFWGGTNLIFSIGLIPYYGARGATMSILSGFVAGLITTWILYLRQRKIK